MSPAMTDMLYRARRALIVQGALALVAGIIMLIWPGLSLQVFALLIAAWLIVDGIVSIIGWFLHRDVGRSSWTLISGILGIIAGVVIAALPDTAVLAIVVFIAVWAIILGVLQIAASLSFRALGAPLWWMLLVSGLAGVVVGIVLIVNPAAGAVSLLWLIAAFLIVAGIALIALGVRAGKRADAVPEAPVA